MKINSSSIAATAFQKTVDAEQETASDADLPAFEPQLKKAKGDLFTEAADAMAILQATPEAPKPEMAFQAFRKTADSRTPRERLLDAVRLQETRSASMNAVDSMTGLQPWSKNWVFQRGDEALLPPGSLPEGDPEGLASLLREIQALQGERRGNDQTVMSLQAAESVADEFVPSERVVLDVLSEPRSQAGNSLSKIVGMDSGVALNPRSAVENALEMGSAPGAPAMVTGEESGLASFSESFDPRVVQGPARSSDQQRLTDWGGAEFVDLKESLKGHKVPSLGKELVARLDPQPAVLSPADSPVGTWRPGRPLGKNGLTPSQESAWRDAIAATVSQGGATRLNQSLAAAGNAANQPRELTAWVTQGSMAQNRLSTEALVGIGAELKSLGQSGGGEMRIRLRPDHLGELSVRVQTQGNEVSLEIVASDAQAKRVIEESVGHLRESLAGQQLTLSKIDLAVSPNPTAGTQQGSDLLGQPGFEQSMSGQMNQGSFSRQQGEQESEGLGSTGTGLSRKGVTASVTPAGSRFAPASRGSASGQIDVIA